MVPKTYVSHQHGGHEQNTPPKPDSSGFAVLGLSPKMLRAIERMEWTEPTPVQLKAIPPALDGQDLIGLAQTGTGKTGAFLIPVVEALSALPQAKPRSPYCIILVPTRELVQQIEVQVKALSIGTRLRSMAIFGGVSEKPQIAALRKGVEIVAATPGRLLDLMGQGVIHFNKVEICVLDEADRMFDMGFINDMKRILGPMPANRQTLLFSATMPPEIQRLTQEFLHHPREIRMGATLPPAELKHEIWELTVPQKTSALEHLLSQKDEGALEHDSVLIFTRTKHRANSLSKKLDRSGQSVAVLHGNRSQNQRDIALRRFKSGQARILVATDVASRGLDISGISLVINFDTPQDPGDYVHRVGRTARANRHGLAITFVVSEEQKYVRSIEQLLKQRIVRRKQANRNNNFIPSTQDNPGSDERREDSSERRRERPDPRRESGSDRDRPKRDGDRPRYEGDRPRRDDGARRYDNRPKRDDDRPKRDDRSRHADDRPRRDGEQTRSEGERTKREGDRRRPEGQPFRQDKPRKQRNRRGGARHQDQQGTGSRSGRESNPRHERQSADRNKDERPARRGKPRPDSNRGSRRGGSDTSNFEGASGPRNWRDEPPAGDQNTRR